MKIFKPKIISLAQIYKLKQNNLLLQRMSINWKNIIIWKKILQKLSIIVFPLKNKIKNKINKNKIY